MNVYAMVIVNPRGGIFNEYEIAGEWSYTEFHLYDDDPESLYNTREGYRMPFRSSNLRRVGFYGRAIYEWGDSCVNELDVDVVTLDTLGMRIIRPINLDIRKPVRIIDVDTRIDMIDIRYIEEYTLDRIEYMTISSPKLPFNGATAVNAHTIMGKMETPNNPFQLGGNADDMYPNILQVHIDFVGELTPVSCLAPMTKYPNIEKYMERYTKY